MHCSLDVVHIVTLYICCCDARSCRRCSMLCRCSEAGATLRNLHTILEDFIIKHHSSTSSMPAQAELCRTMQWFARSSRARNDLHLASQVSSDLDRVLALNASSGSLQAMLPNGFASLGACVACVGATTPAACLLWSGQDHSPRLLFLIYLACALIYCVFAVKRR